MKIWDEERVSREDQQTIRFGAIVFVIAVLVALAALLLLPWSAAQGQTIVVCPTSGTMSAISYASASITTGANTTLTVPTNALIAVVIATPNIVNYRDDGTAPTGSAGMPLPVGVPFPICVGSLSKITFTSPTGLSSTIHLMFYR